MVLRRGGRDGQLYFAICWSATTLVIEVMFPAGVIVDFDDKYRHVYLPSPRTRMLRRQWRRAEGRGVLSSTMPTADGMDIQGQGLARYTGAELI